MKSSIVGALNIQTSLKRQVLVFALLPAIVVACISTYVSASNIVSRGDERVKAYRETLLGERRDMIKNYINLAVKAIDGLPQKQALENIKRLTYGNNGYFWINDYNHFMVSHPDPKLEGTDQTDLKDPNGVYILRELTKLGKERGEGYLSYMWKMPNDDRLQPKVSYAKTIPKWGWIVGTGVYISDIEAMVVIEREKIQKEISSLVATVILVSIGIVVVVGAVATYFANKLVNRPLDAVTSRMKNFDNDLTVRIPVTTKNEIGELAKGFNGLVERLHRLIKKVSETTTDMHHSVNEISAAIGEQATVSSQESAAVAEITSTMEELSASSSQIAEHANAVVEIATRTWDNTKKGARAVETVIVKMNEINLDSQHSISEIVDLGRRSKEISKVMEIINHIADQTKLIAFNAAIEAASAGDAGRRFGVVAAEIRRLADSVMESTEEIAGKINEIQEAINRLVIASEKSSKSIQEGAEFSSETATTLSQIVEAAHETTNAAKQISLSTQQQKTASSQVVVALREIVAGAEHTTVSVDQVSSIGKRLTEAADNLQALVEQFKVTDGHRGATSASPVGDTA